MSTSKIQYYLAIYTIWLYIRFILLLSSLVARNLRRIDIFLSQGIQLSGRSHGDVVSFLFPVSLSISIIVVVLLCELENKDTCPHKHPNDEQHDTNEQHYGKCLRSHAGTGGSDKFCG